MHEMIYKYIFDLYRYDAEDRMIFKSIDQYTHYIDLWIRSNTMNDAQIFRYMLAGFFVDYKACIHLGRNFTTILWKTMKKDRDRLKLEVFNHCLGSPIKDTSTYIIFMHCRTVQDLNLLQTGSGLFSFVCSGTY